LVSGLGDSSDPNVEASELSSDFPAWHEALSSNDGLGVLDG